MTKLRSGMAESMRDTIVPMQKFWVSDDPQSSGAYMDFFGRLREERARLGLTQQEVADAANVHVKTVRRWESQVAIPLDAMIPLLTIGYDVQYVASGVRSKNIHEVRERGVDYEVAPGYTRDEIELLRSYRALSPGQREQAKAMLSVLALRTPAARGTKSARRADSAAPASGKAGVRTRRARA
ncbi:MAG TPA: helix-turn-helix domain-containing protein [Tahibacter sp.]|nr:helix-turn-helix domain-containing protein [Tahibacter sp.]